MPYENDPTIKRVDRKFILHYHYANRKILKGTPLITFKFLWYLIPIYMLGGWGAHVLYPTTKKLAFIAFGHFLTENCIFPRMEITATNRENQRSVARANSTILVVHITGANEFYPRWFAVVPWYET